MVSVNIKAKNLDTMEAKIKKADYHLKELKKTLLEINNTQIELEVYQKKAK